jgi:hypothetical protein
VSIPDNFEMLTPWEIFTTSPEDQNRVDQLSSRLMFELPRKHVLCGLKPRAVAARIDRDDVLFEVDGGAMPLAVVHMTWRKETDPRSPVTKLFQSWDHWVREEMLPAHEEYML